MLLGMLTQANPLGVPQTDGNFKPGVNQFRAKGVDYRAVLESARIFVGSSFAPRRYTVTLADQRCAFLLQSRAGEGLR